MSGDMHHLAVNQDKIGWQNFMEGRISRYFYSIQHFHLSLSTTSHLNGEDWTKRFISNILHIMHLHSVFRNITLHDRQRGYLRLQEKKAVMKEIESLMNTRPEDVPSESRFLLEFD